MDKQEAIQAIMESSRKFVGGVLDSVYKSAETMTVQNEYGQPMININLLKQIIESAKENIKGV